MESGEEAGLCSILILGEAFRFDMNNLTQQQRRATGAGEIEFETPNRPKSESKIFQDLPGSQSQIHRIPL
jgi:hypothetical protein